MKPKIYAKINKLNHCCDNLLLNKKKRKHIVAFSQKCYIVEGTCSETLL